MSSLGSVSNAFRNSFESTVSSPQYQPLISRIPSHLSHPGNRDPGMLPFPTSVGEVPSSFLQGELGFLRFLPFLMLLPEIAESQEQNNNELLGLLMPPRIKHRLICQALCKVFCITSFNLHHGQWQKIITLVFQMSKLRLREVTCSVQSHKARNFKSQEWNPCLPGS